MQILLINQNWFATELRDFGHHVVSTGFAKHLDYVLQSPIIDINHLLALLPAGFSPDRIVWFDNSAPVTVLGLEDCPIPTLMYSVDTHHHHVLHSYVASSFDHVFVAQKDYISSFSVRNTPCSWLPLWASELIEPSEQKQYGAVFVGTLNAKLNPARVAFFEKLQALTSITVMQGHFPSIFPYAEIVVNQTVKRDLNFRVFEAMMSGAMLLTERTDNGLSDLFQDGVHLATYTPDDPHDAASLISRLLSNTSQMREIARAGRDEILGAHLPIHRAQVLDATLRNLEKLPKDPRRHYGALMNLFSLAQSLSISHPDYARDFLRLGIQSMRRALDENAPIDGTESMYVAKSCLQADQLMHGFAGAETLLLFAEALPEVEMFQLLRVRALLNRGQRAQAARIASQAFSSAPLDQVFASAEQAAQSLMSE